MTRHDLVAPIVLLVLTLVDNPSCLNAQESPPRTMTVALAPQLADSSALARIVRQPQQERRFLILLKERDADEALLATAVAALFQSRREREENLSRRTHITLYGKRATVTLTDTERSLARWYLAKLRTAPRSHIPGVGFVQAITVPMGSVHGRNAGL